MKNDLSCEVVQDLLPSYIDGITSKVTKDAVDNHLNGCEQCSQRLSGLRENLMPKDDTSDESWDKTIDAMTMNRHVRHMLYGILITLASGLLIWIGYSILSDLIMDNHNGNFEVTPATYSIDVNENTGDISYVVTLPNGRAFVSSQGLAVYEYNGGSETLIIDFRASYAWGATGDCREGEFNFFDLFQRIEASEKSKLTDYVTEIYIEGIDEPVWTAGQTE